MKNFIDPLLAEAKFTQNYRYHHSLKAHRHYLGFLPISTVEIVYWTLFFSTHFRGAYRGSLQLQRLTSISRATIIPANTLAHTCTNIHTVQGTVMELQVSSLCQIHPVVIVSQHLTRSVHFSSSLAWGASNQEHPKWEKELKKKKKEKRSAKEK